MRTRIVFTDETIKVWEKSYCFSDGSYLDIIDSETKRIKQSYSCSNIKDYSVQDKTVHA